MVRLHRLIFLLAAAGTCLYLIISRLNILDNTDEYEFSQEVEEFLKGNGVKSPYATGSQLIDFDNFESRKTLIDFGIIDGNDAVDSVFREDHTTDPSLLSKKLSMAPNPRNYHVSGRLDFNTIETDKNTATDVKPDIEDTDDKHHETTKQVIISGKSIEIKDKNSIFLENDRSWLYNHPHIVVNEVVSEDLLPSYFDTTVDDMVPQYIKYHNLTKLIMEKRKAKVTELCLKKSRYLKTERRFLYNFPKLGLSWCPTFKCGSTNWKQFFCKIYKPDVYDQYRFSSIDPFCPLETLISFKYNSAISKSEWITDVKNSLKFMTVRHPFERLVSVYNNKFRGCIANMFTSTLMVAILKRFRKVDGISDDEKVKLLEEAQVECHKPISQRKVNKDNLYMNPMGVTFREFIQFITLQQKSGESPDFHWIPITKSCDLCITKFDVIEKFETLERDHYYIFSLIGKEHLYSDIAGSHSNPSGNSSKDLVDYFSTLDEYLLWDLYAIYRDDFELFGYKPNFRLRKDPRKNIDKIKRQ